MRIIVMFDLPTCSKSERKSYQKFRKFLIEDGYRMEQYSVYSRVTLGRNNMNTHIERLQRNRPAAGRITVFALTEKQYENRLTLVCSSGFESSEDDAGAQLTLLI